MIYTLEMTYQDVDNIAENIVRSGWIPEIIVGVQRGGLIPAVMLSHKLNIQMKVVPWSTRDGVERNIPFNVQIAHDYAKKRMLVIDDIIDSGKTVRDLMISLPNARFAALVWNIREISATPWYFGRTLDREIDKEWVNFFWELK
jgi:hypoxanthine phosphoribosyltransferase